MTPRDPRVEAWSRLHHGIDPAAVPFVAPWLRLVWFVARPLRRVPPTAITVVGVVLAGVAVWSASAVPSAALVLVVAAVLCDALDGAVAVLAASASVFGARADALADRACDVLFALVLWRCGAPWWAAAVAAVSAVGVDLLRRARALRAVVTVAERPTFAVCAVLACLCRAISTVRWPAALCAGVWVGLCLVASVQLLRPHAVIAAPAKRRVQR